jgi:predicted TPR repeat methyltransferase
MHMLNAYRGQLVQPQCTSQYIEQTFDAFANSFENVLGRLRYCGPQLVQEHIALHYHSAQNLNVLDLGCGTGLVGTVLQPYAHALTGVDLSQAMLNQAASKQLYHQLHKTDITAYLAATHEQFDLITCMDTLIYLGQLDEIFALMQCRLKPNGMLIFSTEKLAVANDLGYKLNISGRYSHHADYLVSSLTKAGFQINHTQDVPIRTEAGYQIEGQFICASLTATAMPDEKSATAIRP